MKSKQKLDSHQNTKNNIIEEMDSDVDNLCEDLNLKKTSEEQALNNSDLQKPSKSVFDGEKLKANKIKCPICKASFASKVE